MSEEKIDPQKFYEMQMLEEQIKATQQMLDNGVEQLSNLRATISAIKEFDNLNGKEEFLFPLSNGILANGKLQGKKLLVNVGAGVVKEKSIKSTINSLEEQEKEVEDFIKKIEAQYSELIEKIEDFKDL